MIRHCAFANAFVGVGLQSRHRAICPRAVRLYHSVTMAAFPPRKVVSENVYDSMTDAIGNTPLIKLQRASRETGCNIYGKAEFMNPGGSVKARAALYLIMDAENKGLLVPGKPGQCIVEATAGNTGVLLSLVERWGLSIPWFLVC